jgi:hypothetical protein
MYYFTRSVNTREVNKPSGYGISQQLKWIKFTYSEQQIMIDMPDATFVTEWTEQKNKKII